jgi:hypothetical protein
MIKKFFTLLTLFLCFSVHSQEVDAANNAIKMGYNFVTVSQTVVFNTAMQSGGTLTLSANAMDGGGRAPGDPFVLKLVFYNSSNAIVNTAQLSNTLVYGATTPTTYTMSTTNCGGSCASVAYVSVQFYGKDGGYWAGNYGPYIINPSLTFNGGSNILYNPEFGVYGTNGFAQGWASTAGWQNCALYSGAATCVINNGAPVNAAGGGYSASGGSTSSPPGGQTSAPPAPTYPSYVTIGGGTAGTMTFTETSSLTTPQQNKVTTWTNKIIQDGNNIYIDQISGNSNTVTMEQDGNKNKITATLDGSSNTVTVKQGTQGIGQNEIKLGVTGSYNAVDISQSRNNQGSIVGSNGHYHDATVTGSNNTLTAQQSNTGGVGGNYMETTVNGNQNSITARQTDNGNKIMFTSITGNNNTVEAIQKGTGQHYLENKLTGNGNSVSALQEGSTANRATLDLTNAGGPASVILQQNGGQNVSVTTSCTTAGGCAPITVRQGY